MNQTESNLIQVIAKLAPYYEFYANSTYNDRPPMPPQYIFIIDTSLNSIQSGFFSSCIEALKDLISNDLLNDRTKIGFLTYDTQLNFFKFNLNYSTPQMLCISDKEIFLPAPVKINI